jgi:hypothetical protein
MNPQAASFFIYMKSGLKVKRRREKRVKSREKTLNFFFHICAFMREEEISLIKKACFMLNFLNLKSKAIHLFFG